MNGIGEATNAAMVDGNTHSGGHETTHVCVVSVTYDGRTEVLKANLEAAAQALLQRAIQQFGVTQQPHTLSLWTRDGKELLDQSSLVSQGVRCEDLLLLRPGAVKGGCR